MTTTDLTTWVDKIASGTLDLADLESLENVALEDLLEQLRQHFPVGFLDRRIRDKREVGLAERVRSSPMRRSQFFRNCRLLTCEGQALTTVTTMTFLRAQPSSDKPDSLQLDSGTGFSLYRDPDGWKIKLIEDRTVHLPVTLLVKHGWLIGPNDNQ